eukprot:4921953-Prymnesium_polylepis.1
MSRAASGGWGPSHGVHTQPVIRTLALTHPYTPVHAHTHPYAPVRACTRPYTPIRAHTRPHTPLRAARDQPRARQCRRRPEADPPSVRERAGISAGAGGGSGPVTYGTACLAPATTHHRLPTACHACPPPATACLPPATACLPPATVAVALPLCHALTRVFASHCGSCSNGRVGWWTNGAYWRWRRRGDERRRTSYR